MLMAPKVQILCFQPLHLLVEVMEVLVPPVITEALEVVVVLRLGMVGQELRGRDMLVVMAQLMPLLILLVEEAVALER